MSKNFVTLRANVEENDDFRGYVKNLIRGQVKKIIKEELIDIAKEEISKEVERFKREQVSKDSLFMKEIKTWVGNNQILLRSTAQAETKEKVLTYIDENLENIVQEVITVAARFAAQDAVKSMQFLKTIIKETGTG